MLEVEVEKQRQTQATSYNCYYYSSHCRPKALPCTAESQLHSCTTPHRRTNQQHSISMQIIDREMKRTRRTDPPTHALAPCSSRTAFSRLMLLRSARLRSRAISLLRSIPSLSASLPTESTLVNRARRTCSCGVITSGSPADARARRGLAARVWVMGVCAVGVGVCAVGVGVCAIGSGVCVEGGCAAGSAPSRGKAEGRLRRSGDGECEVLRADTDAEAEATGD